MKPLLRPQSTDKNLEQLTSSVSSFPGQLEIIACEVPQRAVLQGVFALKCLSVLGRLEPSGRPLLFPPVPLLCTCLNHVMGSSWPRRLSSLATCCSPAFSAVSFAESEPQTILHTMLMDQRTRNMLVASASPCALRAVSPRGCASLRRPSQRHPTAVQPHTSQGGAKPQLHEDLQLQRRCTKSSTLKDRSATQTSRLHSANQRQRLAMLLDAHSMW